MSSAGADCVMALVDTASTPVAANEATDSRVMPPLHSSSGRDRPAPGYPVVDGRDGLRRFGGVEVVEEHGIG